MAKKTLVHEVWYEVGVVQQRPFGRRRLFFTDKSWVRWPIGRGVVGVDEKCSAKVLRVLKR